MKYSNKRKHFPFFVIIPLRFPSKLMVEQKNPSDSKKCVACLHFNQQLSILSATKLIVYF